MQRTCKTPINRLKELMTRNGLKMMEIGTNHLRVFCNGKKLFVYREWHQLTLPNAVQRHGHMGDRNAGDHRFPPFMTGGRIMGGRLHFATRHKVEFASTERFKYRTYEFHSLLDALEVGYSGEAFDEEFECPADEWARGLRRLQDGDFSEDVRKALDGLGAESLKDVIYAMSMIADRSDTSDGFIHLAFF